MIVVVFSPHSVYLTVFILLIIVFIYINFFLCIFSLDGAKAHSSPLQLPYLKHLGFCDFFIYI